MGICYVGVAWNVVVRSSLDVNGDGAEAELQTKGVFGLAYFEFKTVYNQKLPK